MKMIWKLAVTSALTLAVVGPANAAVITFDDLTVGATVDNFYNGGGGPNLGVDFFVLDWEVQTGFGQTSQPNFAFSRGGNGFFNIAAGFTGALSFTYGAFTNFTATVYDGLNGTGNALGSLNLAANNVSAFDLVAITFSGTGQSFAISGGAGQFGFDDVTFNESGAVPEPASWALMIAGFGLVGSAMRRRKPSVSVSYA
jgi:PEP-CTERM motif